MKYYREIKIYSSIFRGLIVKVLVVLLLSISQIQLSAQNLWYKGNTHAHTTNSDGNLSPATLASRYQAAGYQFLFITDHNFVTPVKNLSAPGFLCMSGEEITFGRHFNGLGIQRLVSPISNQYSVDSVQVQGSIPTLNHPVWTPTRVYSKEILNMDELDFIEIHNALTESWGFHDNQMLWDSLLTSGRLIYGIASDDEHSSEHIGKGWIMVQSNALQQDSIIRSMQTGRFYSSIGILFSDIQVSRTTIAIVTKNATLIKFIGDSGKLLKLISGNKGEYPITGNELYIRVEASNDHGEKAWTQPLFWNTKYGGEIIGSSTISIGNSTEMLTLVGFEGTILRWQKRLNNGPWISIPLSSKATLSESPQLAGTWEYRVEVRRNDHQVTWSKSAVIKVKFDTTAVNSGIIPDFFIYPNPTPDYLNIQGPELLQFTSYTVSNLSGKIVLAGELIQNSFGQSGIEMSALPKGFYFVKFSGERINKVVQVVKE